MKGKGKKAKAGKSPEVTADLRAAVPELKEAVAAEDGTYRTYGTNGTAGEKAGTATVEGTAAQRATATRETEENTPRASSAASCATTDKSVASPGQHTHACRFRATDEEGTAAQRAAATAETPARRSHKRGENPSKRESMLQRWREIRAGKRPHPDKMRPPDPAPNPLFDLPESKRSELYAWMRDCPDYGATRERFAEDRLEDITHDQFDEFYRDESDVQVAKRIERAAIDANALIRHVKKSDAKFSKAIMHELGQQTFKHVSNGSMLPGIATQLAALFLRARSDDRADKMHKLKRRQLRNELKGEINHALDNLAKEIGRRPAAKKAFAALRRELASGEAERTEI